MGFKSCTKLSSPNQNVRGSSHDVVAKVLDCDIIVYEFELQWRYYVHLRTNNLEKDMISHIFQAMG